MIDNREKHVVVRLTETEHQTLKELADRNYMSMSQFLRKLFVEQLIK